ncbi:EamA family transporter [bacterium]|nr:EamA family transporter [bacterium]
MSNWFIYTLVVLFMWGLWGFFPKLATNYLDPRSAMVFGAMGSLVIALGVASTIGFKVQVHPKGILFAVLTGVCGSLGALFFLIAVSKSKATLVVTSTSLYPLITILLAFIFLNETITLKQGLGMFFALIALLLFSV